MNPLYARDVVGEQSEAISGVLPVNRRVAVDERTDERETESLRWVADGGVDHLAVDAVPAAFPLDFAEALDPERLRVGREFHEHHLLAVVRSLHQAEDEIRIACLQHGVDDGLVVVAQEIAVLVHFADP